MSHTIIRDAAPNRRRWRCVQLNPSESWEVKRLLYEKLKKQNISTGDYEGGKKILPRKPVSVCWMNAIPTLPIIIIKIINDTSAEKLISSSFGGKK